MPSGLEPIFLLQKFVARETQVVEESLMESQHQMLTWEIHGLPSFGVPHVLLSEVCSILIAASAFEAEKSSQGLARFPQ